MYEIFSLLGLISTLFSIIFMSIIIYKSMKFSWVETSIFFWGIYSVFLMNFFLYIVSDNFSLFIIIWGVASFYFFRKKDEIVFPVFIKDTEIRNKLIKQILLIKNKKNNKKILKTMKKQIIYISENKEINSEMNILIENFIKN